MKAWTAFLIVCLFGEIILTCLVGACAALAGLSSLDNWCQRHLEDTDGQAEKESAD